MNQKKLKALREERDRLYDKIPQEYRERIASYFLDRSLEEEVEVLRVDSLLPEDYWLGLDKEAERVNKELVEEFINVSS